MVKASVNVMEEYDMVIDSIQKNVHLLNDNSSSNHYKFNNRILLSNSTEFLNAVKTDVGGEIILDSAIGPFLFFGDENQE